MQSINNSILNKDVILNEEAINEYNKIKREDPDTYPYQSRDMKDKGSVRFTKSENIKHWLENKESLQQVQANYKYIGSGPDCNVDLPSDIDIFKMKDKYLYQEAGVEQISLGTIDKVIDRICDNSDISKIFVPFVNKDIDVNTIDPYPRYGFHIINDKEFIDKLRSDLTQEDVGRIIFGLDYIFWHYKKYKTVNIDEITKFDWKKLYGLNRKQVADILWERNEELRHLQSFMEDIDDGQNCQILINGHINNLSNQQSLIIDDEINQEYVEKKNKCWLKELELDKLIDKRITKLKKPSERTIKEYIKICSGPFVFSPTENYVDCDAGIDLLKDYMPEWTYYMGLDKKEYAFENRQLVLGEGSITKKLKACPEIVRADPFITDLVRLSSIGWNMDINKALIYCVLNSDLIFPIRVYFPSDKIPMYTSFTKNDNNYLLGSILIRGTGRRFKGKTRFFNLFTYYDKASKNLRSLIKIANFRNNFIAPGTLNDHVRVLYIELNVLMYLKKDFNMNIYFYNYTGTNTIFVSRYTLDEIKVKYSQIEMFKDRVDDILGKLDEVQILKDNDKNIYFTKNIQSGGNKQDSYGQLVSLPEIKTDWDIKFSKNKVAIHPKFPKNKVDQYINIFKSLVEEIGPDIKKYLMLADYYSPLVSLSKYGKIFKDLNKKIFRTSETRKQDLLAYNFRSIYVEFRFYEVINKWNLLKDEENLLIIASNGFVLNAVIYYTKYHVRKFNNKRINIILHNHDKKKDRGFTEKIINDNKVNAVYNNKPMNNDNIRNLVYSKKMDLILLDYNFRLDVIGVDRINEGFQGIFSSLIIALESLKNGGNVLINIPLLPVKEYFDFFNYIGNFFNESFIYETDIVIRRYSFSILAFIGYKGGIDVNKLYEINKRYYECEPQGGIGYMNANCYLNKLVKKPDSDAYDNYCKLIDNKYNEGLQLLQRVNKYKYKNANNPEEIISRNILYSISYAKKIGLKVADWVENKDFFPQTFKKISNSVDPYVEKFKHGCKDFTITENKEVKYNNRKHLDNLYILSESAYEYVENINYKPVELFFNAVQKGLQNKLLKERNISIGGKRVNRAWIKLFELYSETNYFNNLRSSINAFHICEAPGNFIASSIYYTKLKGKQYNWKAQSLMDSNIFDQYGFIKNNPGKWDFGDGSGDIVTNLEYYYEKYKGVDSLVGDCGLPWGEKDVTRNLGTYQLIYGLLLPKTGGNFILKTNAVNFDLQYLSLLYTACAKYDKLFVFRSSRNFWSPEVYIVGIGKKELSKNEEDVLLKIVIGLRQGKIIYPVDQISMEFGVEYEYHMQNLIDNFVEIKKFMVYLIRNPEKYKQIKGQIEGALVEKNKVWMDKYLG